MLGGAAESIVVMERERVLNQNNMKQNINSRVEAARLDGAARETRGARRGASIGRPVELPAPPPPMPPSLKCLRPNPFPRSPLACDSGPSRAQSAPTEHALDQID